MTTENVPTIAVESPVESSVIPSPDDTTSQSLMGDLTNVTNAPITQNPQGFIQTPSENTQEAAPWYLAEGIVGQGVQPEYLITDKYKSVSDQAKGYKEIFDKLSAHQGAPEEYNLDFIKESGVEIDPNQPQFKAFMELSKESNINQKYFQEAISKYIELDKSRHPNLEEERAKLGVDGAEKMNVLRQWAVNTLPADEAEAICYAATSAAFIRAIDKWRNGTQPTVIPHDPKLIPPRQPTSSVAQLNQEMIDNYDKYCNDPIYREEYSRRLDIATKTEGTQM